MATLEAEGHGKFKVPLRIPSTELTIYLRSSIIVGQYRRSGWSHNGDASRVDSYKSQRSGGSRHSGDKCGRCRGSNSSNGINGGGSSGDGGRSSYGDRISWWWCW